MTEALAPEKTETADLREIVSQCAAATGAFCSPAASLDFMRLVPGEIIASLKAERRCTAVMAARATAAEAQAAKMREALEFYANAENYKQQLVTEECGCCSYWHDEKIGKEGDEGEVARAALASPAQEPQDAK